MKTFLFVVCLIPIFFYTDILFAESVDDELRKEIEGLKKDVRRLVDAQKEHITKTHQLGEEISGFKEHILHRVGDILLTGGITSILQGTTDIDEEEIFDYSYTLDINIEADVSENGKVVVALESGNGSGLNDNLSSISIVNYDPFITETSTGQNAFATISVSQAFYEGSYYNERLIVSVGKLDVHQFTDDNAFANDETDQFITGLFARSQGTIFAELDSYYAPGIVVVASPAEWVNLMVVAANGNGSGFEDLFDNGYGSAQITLKTSLMDKAGNYSFYGIFDHRNYTDINNPDNIKENVGYGLSVDQELTNDLGIFARIGMQDDGIISSDIYKNTEESKYIVESTYSFGMQLTGERWGRTNDVFGIGYGSVNLNKKGTKKLQGISLTVPDKAIANPDDETHLEVYYKVTFSEHFTMSPDFQIVTNMGGDSNADRVKIYGIRTQLNF
ncbi:MAG: carbohydrate porin [Nitrospirota bacterium]